MVQDDKPVGPDGVEVEFDDERVVSHAGVMLVATLAGRLGLEALAADLRCPKAQASTTRPPPPVAESCGCLETSRRCSGRR